jgi:MFS family permease
MSACCLSMGFATDLLSCAVFRLAAGLVSSSIVVVCLTMIGDLSRDPAERAGNIAKMPLIAVLGAIGPVTQGFIAKGVEQSGGAEVWRKFPTLSGQIACASVVFVITISACVMLEEVSLTVALIMTRTDLNDRHCHSKLMQATLPILTARRPPSLANPWTKTVSSQP